MMKKQWILSCSAVFLLISCHSDSPPPVSEERFAQVYAQVLVAASVRDSLGARNDELSGRVRSAIESAGMTKEEFLSALQWYSGDLHRWSQLVEKSAKILEMRLAAPAAR